MAEGDSSSGIIVFTLWYLAIAFGYAILSEPENFLENASLKIPKSRYLGQAVLHNLYREGRLHSIANVEADLPQDSSSLISSIYVFLGPARSAHLAGWLTIDFIIPGDERCNDNTQRCQAPTGTILLILRISIVTR
ncbi:hypothetical protein RR48_03585 [Papilio machaon]|uniref:Uncharacterized protein n=1 Tax=Papilio machaon TaxID=76193 RepID=A0A0N1I878_PAPMA|nr:hypothetical protein RR48_03585 [Papilio machaon]